MSSFDFIVRSSRIVTPHGIVDGAVAVKGEKIAAVLERGQMPSALREFDAEDCAVLPGVVDTHAHIHGIGLTESKGFEEATRAAAAAGITTIVVMPMDPASPTTSVGALHSKEIEAHGTCWVDYGFWAGLVPGKFGELSRMADAGVLGFKGFLRESGIEGFPMLHESDLRKAMPILKKRGLPLLVHAEIAGAVGTMIRLCRETGCHVHVVHVSSAETLDKIIEAKRESLAITAETCPVHLNFSEDERLWSGLAEGWIDFVVCDRSPVGEFGISAIWAGMKKRGLGLQDLARRMCEEPARFAGLGGRKGAIAAGMDADMIFLNDGDKVTIEATFVRGRAVYEHGEFVGGPGGHPVNREKAAG